MSMTGAELTEALKAQLDGPTYETLQHYVEAGYERARIEDVSTSVEAWRRLMRYISARLREGSTWRGAALLTGLGGALAANPERAAKILSEPTSMETLVGLGLFVSGLIGALWPERKE